MDWKRLKNNPQNWQNFRKRAEVLDKIRQFFKKEKFLEIQTPLLSPFLVPESYLEIFETELSDKMGRKKRAFLTPSPELWHKRLLVAGSSNIFEITKAFRNTDIGGHFHNPEFTILEWYRVGVDCQATMRDCENLIRFINGGKNKLTYQGKTLDIGKPFERISVVDAFARFAKIDRKTLFDKKKLRIILEKRGYRLKKSDNWEAMFELAYLKEVEPHLGQKRPTIIYNFPAEFAPLAKTNKKDRRVKERFELYLFGIELADAYNELNDWREQERRFAQEAKLRKKNKKIIHPIDTGFIAALKEGLPDCSGVALGVDRLAMIFANVNDINEITLFSGEDIFMLK